MRSLAICFFLLISGCSIPPSLADDSLVPGTIGVAVGPDKAGVVITDVRPGSSAARADLRPGDVITSYDGNKILNGHEFESLLLKSEPGTTARLEVMRAGTLRSIEVPVEEMATAPPV